MPCPEDRHDWVAVNPFVHPTEKGSDGKPLEVMGAPPQTEGEPAWCRTCGTLRSKRPKGLSGLLGRGGTQWGLSHPAIDKDAPTIANMMRDTDKAKRRRTYLSILNGKLALRTIAPLTARTEAEIAFLQETLWEKMTAFERRMLEAHIELLKNDWPDAASSGTSK